MRSFLFFVSLFSNNSWKWGIFTLMTTSFLSWLMIPGEKNVWKHFVSKINLTYYPAIRFISDHEHYIKEHERKLDSAWKSIQDQTKWEVYAGSVDVYNFEQVQLLASGNQ